MHIGSMLPVGKAMSYLMTWSHYSIQIKQFSYKQAVFLPTARTSARAGRLLWKNAVLMERKNLSMQQVAIVHRNHLYQKIRRRKSLIQDIIKKNICDLQVQMFREEETCVPEL